MTTSAGDDLAEDGFAPVVDATAAPEVHEAAMFGARILLVNNKMFASLHHGRLAVKLGDGTPEYARALELSGSSVWAPTNAEKPFRRWVSVGLEHSHAWPGLAVSALHHVMNER